jgi:hypothetical protein
VLTGRGCFCSGSPTDREETLVTGRRSGRGGRRSGQGGAPWRRGACCGVGGVGINRSGHPLVRYSQRKTAVGKSRGPASLAVAVGRLLAHEGHRDEALLLARSDSSGRLVGDGQQRA